MSPTDNGSALKYRVDAHELLIKKHDQDLYDGDKSSPGLTIRMALVEQELDKMTRNINKLVWIVVAAVLERLFDVAGSIAHHFLK